MVLNIKYATDNCWKEVCKKVGNAVIFVDNCSAECLHWHGGLIRLLSAGATEVKEFSSFEDGGEEKKAVFLVGKPLVGTARMILKDIISNSSFEHCILIMSCGPVVLSVVDNDRDSQSDASNFTPLHKLEMDLLHWMKNKAYTVEIFHFPFGLISITDYFFCAPTLNNIVPWMDEDLEYVITQCRRSREWDLELLPRELQLCVVHVMATLNSLLSQLNAQEDIYCVGPFSSFVGCHLQKHSTSISRAKSATSKMGLLLIDRTLDVASVTYYGKNCFLDRMKSVLPPFPGHSTDVAIDMSILCPSKVEPSDELYVPGCLHEPMDEDLMEWLIHRTPQEIVEKLCRRVFEICSVDKRKSSLTIKDLEKLIEKHLKMTEGNEDKIMKNVGLLQVAVGVIETYKSKNVEKLQRAESYQKLILQQVATENKRTNEAIDQLICTINSRHEEGLTMEHILAILVFFYNVIGKDFLIEPDQEALLQSALAEAIGEEKDSETPDNFLDADSIFDVKQYCSKIFKKLNSIKDSRANLIKYKSITTYEGSMMPLHYSNLINNIICDIVDVTKPEIPDLLHKPNLGVRENFTFRFSKMLNTARPHLMDNENVMVFVIGGVTGQEVKFIKDCFKAYDKNVLIGSTSYTSPGLLLKNLFNNDPLNPFSI